MQVKNLVVGLILLSASTSFSQTVEQGLKHMELEQYESSKKVFRSLMKADQTNPEYNYYMGEVYLRTDNQDSAKYFFSEGIKKKDSYALNYAGLGKAVPEKNTTEAKVNFDKALELSKSKDAKVLGAIAEYYINSSNKNFEIAISLLDKAIKADSKNPVYYMLLGDAYLGKNDGSQAIANYNKGFDLNKSWPYPYLKIGKLYTRARNYNLAVEFYNKGLAIDPNYGPLHREIGEVYYKAKQYSKAIASYKRYVELSDKNFDTDLRYASFLHSSKDYANALAILSNLAKQDANNPLLNRMLAYSYYETGDYTKGLATMENFWKSADSKKYRASDFEYYGKLLAKNGKDSLAISNYRKAVEMDTSKTELYGEMGSIYFASKRYKDAAREYSLKVSKGGATAQDYLVLGRSYYFDQNYSSADSSFTKLISVAPTSPVAYLWKARANAYLDQDFSKGLAKQHYEKYIELTKPADVEKYKKELVEAYNQIGLYYAYNKKDKANAELNWKKALELDPTNKEIQGFLKGK